MTNYFGALLKNKIDATVAPSKTNDASEGYGYGSGWIIPSQNKAFFCSDPTIDNAVWKLILSNGLVINKTGSTLTKGSVVYINGAQGNRPKAVLARADSESTSSNTIGLILEDILNNNEGYVVTIGTIIGVNTSGMAEGSLLWLSPSINGRYTTTKPTTPNHSVYLGTVLYEHVSNGIICVHINNGFELSELHDVLITLPQNGEAIVYDSINGYWKNAAASITSGTARDYYLDDTIITDTGVDNNNEIVTLSKVPAGGTTITDTIIVNNNTVLKEAYLDDALGGTQIEGGLWEFAFYAGVSNASNTTEILLNIGRARVETVTVTITGTGTSRTATASGGTPFATSKIDIGGTIDSDSYLQTPKGLYRITARTSDTVVTITTPTTYTNESSVALSVWKRLFQQTSGDINTTTITLIQGINSIQPAYSIESTDKLFLMVFGKTTRASDTTISFTHNGTTQYSRFKSPLLDRHNGLSGLNEGDYKHLTANEKLSSDASVKGSIQFIIDGQGSPITAGVMNAVARAFRAGTITSSWIVSRVGGVDTAKSISCDIYKNGSKISASAPVALSAASEALDTTLTGWTTSISATDEFTVEVTGTPTAEYVAIELRYNVTGV